MALAQLYSEEELVVALKAKNQQAFSYLYNQYSGSLYTIILQIVRSPEIAGDVLQEVFLNIWKKFDTYDSVKGRLFTWMLNISRNAAIDLLRSKAYQNNQKNREINENVYFGGQSDKIDIDGIGISKFLERIPPEKRVLIELAYFKGFTHEEIAEIEGLPLGTVKTRIRNALLELRELLK